jgi:hypothetical protein
MSILNECQAVKFDFTTHKLTAFVRAADNKLRSIEIYQNHKQNFRHLDDLENYLIY